MNTRDYFKMQSINFCYMCFMQDGEVIPAIDIDPNQSTHDIKQWTDNYPSLHEKVLMLMEANQ